VKTYLGEHPEFLDSYIQQNVNANTIEQWRLRKTPAAAATTTTTIAAQSGAEMSTTYQQHTVASVPTSPLRSSSSLSSMTTNPTLVLPVAAPISSKHKR
jgi:CMP-N-acetylneuraminic acid synthetase